MFYQLKHSDYENAEDLQEAFISANGYQTMTDEIPLQTSPKQLLDAAKAIPLNNRLYDLLFSNCQLFILLLLCGTYGVERSKLPLAVGGITAAPCMLIFSSIYYFLLP